ncbi:MAG: class I SAM-dependent methyltransferase, partial [Lachnospiraceae bacterium]|nr:class I SAM-dependent methyltransferase [Lachnospiraceae bacterium]
MKILVFGSGGAYAAYAEKYSEYFKNVDILAFADNSKEKQGQIFNGKPIISPQEISQYCYDAILICSSYQEEIYEQLVTEFNIHKENIYT